MLRMRGTKPVSVADITATVEPVSGKVGPRRLGSSLGSSSSSSSSSSSTAAGPCCKLAATSMSFKSLKDWTRS